MQRIRSTSSNHFPDLKQTDTMPNDIVIPVIKVIDDYDDSEIKVYRQLRPLLILMKLFGLYFRRATNKFGKLRTDKCIWYCLFISFLMIVNVIRSFSVYRFGDAFNHALVQKVMFTIWSTECTLKGIILFRACYRQKDLPYFFIEWKHISQNTPLDNGVCS